MRAHTAPSPSVRTCCAAEYLPQLQEGGELARTRTCDQIARASNVTTRAHGSVVHCRRLAPRGGCTNHALRAARAAFSACDPTGPEAAAGRASPGHHPTDPQPARRHARGRVSAQEAAPCTVEAPPPPPARWPQAAHVSTLEATAVHPADHARGEGAAAHSLPLARRLAGRKRERGGAAYGR